MEVPAEQRYEEDTETGHHWGWVEADEFAKGDAERHKGHQD